MTLAYFHVGCDISKATIDFVDGSTNTHQQIANTKKEIVKFLKPYRDKNVRFAFEATGYYGLELQNCLSNLGLAGIQINPLHARRFAQSRGCLAKTDRIDAAQLADMAKRFDLPPTKDFCRAENDLKFLIMRRDQIVDQRANEKKRLRQTDLEVVTDSLQRAIDRLDEEIKLFDKLIEQAIDENPEFARKNKLLQTMPGIAKAIAPVLIAMLGELGEASRREIAALAGLAPFNHDSGTMRGHRSIAGGRQRVRRALYIAALGNISSKSKLAEKYRALREAGKPAKVALIAIARKIVTIINAMLKTGMAYQ